MLVRTRTIALPGFGPCVSAHEVVHPTFLLRSLEHHGVVDEDQIVYPKVPFKGAVGRAVATIVLAGQQRVAVPGESDRWLAAGDFALGKSLGDFYRRDQGSHSHSLSIEWEPGSLGPRPTAAVSVGVLDGRALAALRVATDQFRASADDPLPSSDACAVILSLLQSFGLPFDGPFDRGRVYDPTASEFASLSAAIDRTLSVSDTSPMMIDLEEGLQCSRWQVRRRIVAMHQRFAIDGSNWHVIRDRWRIIVALAMLSHESQTIDSVAMALGYGAPHALYRAFARLHLPAPGRVREALKRLE